MHSGGACGATCIALNWPARVDTEAAARGAGLGLVEGRLRAAAAAAISSATSPAAPPRSRDSDLDALYALGCLRLRRDEMGDVELGGRDLPNLDAAAPAPESEPAPESWHLSLFIIQCSTFSLQGTGGGAMSDEQDVSVRHKPESPKSAFLTPLTPQGRPAATVKAAGRTRRASGTDCDLGK